MVVDADNHLSVMLRTPKLPPGSLLISRKTMNRKGTSKSGQRKVMKTMTTDINTISRHLKRIAKLVDNTKGTKKKHGTTDKKNNSRISVEVRTMTIIVDRTTLLATTKTTKLAKKARVMMMIATKVIVMTSAGRLSSDSLSIRSDGLTLAGKNITSSPINEAVVK